MRWFPFFRRKSKPAETTADVLARYRQARAVSRTLNVALAQRLPRSAVPECGKKLGLVKAGTLILNNDDEIAVVYDYCLHHYRRAGKNEIERYLAEGSPADAMEAELLEAMTASWFSLFRILEIRPHQGALLRDLMTGKSVDLTDRILSETANPGVIVAGRMLPLPGFTMSSGILIPIPEAAFVDRVEPVIATFTRGVSDPSDSRLSPAQEAAFAARVLRIALHVAGEDNAFYSDMEA